MLSAIEKFITFGRTTDGIEELLSKPDCTLEKLLDDDNFVEEVRSPPSKLVSLYAFLFCAPLLLMHFI